MASMVKMGARCMRGLNVGWHGSRPCLSIQFYHKPLIGQIPNQRFVVLRMILIPTNSKSVFSVLSIKYLV